MQWEQLVLYIVLVSSMESYQDLFQYNKWTDQDLGGHLFIGLGEALSVNTVFIILEISAIYLYPK